MLGGRFPTPALDIILRHGCRSAYDVYMRWQSRHSLLSQRAQKAQEITLLLSRLQVVKLPLQPLV